VEDAKEGRVCRRKEGRVCRGKERRKEPAERNEHGHTHAEYTVLQDGLCAVALVWWGRGEEGGIMYNGELMVMER
jgi:hypothetical protein